MAKKRSPKSEAKPRKTLPFSGVEPAEAKMVIDELDARVHGYLDELDRMIEAARESEPDVPEERILAVWVMKKIAILEMVTQRMSEQIGPAPGRDG